MTSIVVIDTETTGLSHTDGGVVEIAAVRLFWNGKSYDIGPVRDCLVDPERDIPVAASAVHHLTNKDVKGARKLPEALEYLELRTDDVFVAHNVDFDRGFFPEHIQNRPWVCTWKTSQKLITDAPAFGNQVLRYHLGIEVEGGNGRAGQAHSAGYDARTTAGIMAHLLTLATLDELIAITQAPVLLARMPFGKHRGLAFTDVPKDYLAWLKGRPDLDRDLKHTLEHHT
jgi:exodeoxyribonuclease X